MIGGLDRAFTGGSEGNRTRNRVGYRVEKPFAGSHVFGPGKGLCRLRSNAVDDDPRDRRLAMTRYESRDGRLRLFGGDSPRLHPITTGSVGVIVTSPPYWVRGRGRPSAERYAHDLAVGFGREWKRVLAPDGDLWLVIGDRHDGAEWVGMDALVIGWLRRTGWRLQSRGFLGPTRSRERLGNRVNHLPRFRKVGQVVRPRGTTL